MNKTNVLRPLPQWVNPTLQALAFWMGYRKEVFPGYDLIEGALVSEMLTLLKGNCAPGERVFCEVMYRDFLQGNDIGAADRADLVISTSSEIGDQKQIKYVIEVKRQGASHQALTKDLMRLSRVLRQLPEARAFMVHFSQKHRPSNLVSDKGTALRHPGKPFNTANCSVRRFCKASASLAGPNAAHYAALIEVFR